MKLLVADDHILFRDALLQYICRAEPDAEILVSDDLDGAIDYLQQGEKPQAVLLDYRMPGMKGLDGLQRVRTEFPEFPVILMSGVIETADIEKAIEMGITGYFPKTMSGKAFINAIQMVLSGEKFFSYDAEAKKLMASYKGDRELAGQKGTGANELKNKGLNILSEREKEVLTYLLDGSSNKEIANVLNLQEVTIKLHVRGICRKLGAKNRTQAALIAQEGGFEAIA
jgi:DNA-binding NarL/FixJ family response regulator